MLRIILKIRYQFERKKIETRTGAGSQALLV